MKIFKWREEKAHLVARGRGKFMPPKPGGRCMAMKHFPDFRGATPTTRGGFYRYIRMIVSPSGDEIPAGPRRNQRLFWRREFVPSPGTPGPPNFPLPEFFHSFRGGRGDFSARVIPPSLSLLTSHWVFIPSLLIPHAFKPFGRLALTPSAVFYRL